MVEGGGGGWLLASGHQRACPKMGLSSHITEAFLSNLKHSLGLNHLESNPKDLGKKGITNDERLCKIPTT